MKFPAEWKVGEPSTNGDGLALNTDPSNQVSVYAGFRFPMDLTSYDEFRLNNGGIAKITDQQVNNTVLFHMLYTKNNIDYQIKGEVTVEFFNHHLNDIEEMILSFETFKGEDY